LNAGAEGAAAGVRLEVTGSDWTNIIIPGGAALNGKESFSLSNTFHHQKEFVLTDLAEEAQYECLVQARNKYGWSEASRIHNFYTHNSYGEREVWTRALRDR